MSVQANELRLGNKIVSRIVFVTNPLSKDVITCDEDFLEVLFAARNYADYEPIPLTPELLIKCGFEKTKEADFILSIDLHQHIQMITGRDNWCYPIFIQDPEMSHENVNMVSFNRISSLHKLQNLYFAITSKELNIEP